MDDIELAELLDNLASLCYEASALIAECKANERDYTTTARIARLMKRNAHNRVAVENAIYAGYHAALKAAYKKGKRDAFAENT